MRDAPAARGEATGASKTVQPSMVETVYEALREGILSGRYPAGAPLRSSRIAAEHGLSYIPVREAMRRLEAERLVTISNFKGARVAPASVGDMRDVFAMRILLESEALSQAMPRLDPPTLGIAESVFSVMAERYDSGDDASVYQTHREFHFVLYEPGGSRWLLYLINLLWDNGERYVRRSLRLAETPGEFRREHAEILKAARARDPERAVEVLRHHLLRASDQLTAVYAADEAIPSGPGKARMRRRSVAAGGSRPLEV